LLPSCPRPALNVLKGIVVGDPENKNQLWNIATGGVFHLPAPLFYLITTKGQLAFYPIGIMY
jgi:hypothetical protein